MNYCKYDLYIKMLYIDAGKTVMDSLFSVFSPYIRYDRLYRIYNKISASPFNNDFAFNDSFGAFFHKLCCKLSNDIYTNDVIYYIFSPYNSEDVIYQMLIPNKNSVFINNSASHICKANKLYSIDNSDKFDEYLHFSKDLFERSEKIQQE